MVIVLLLLRRNSQRTITIHAVSHLGGDLGYGHPKSIAYCKCTSDSEFAIAL